MKTLKVYGASDDLIETEGLDGCDEFYNYLESTYKGFLRIESQGRRDNIHIIYAGVWSFSWAMEDEDKELLGKFKSLKSDGGYSMVLEIEYPDDAVLSYVKT